MLFVIAVPVLALLYVYLYTSFYSPKEPEVDLKFLSAKVESSSNNSFRTLDNNWALKINDELYICYTEGSPEKRGYAYGALLNDLMYHQEKALFDRMKETIDGEMYRSFLCRLARFYNSGILESLTDEQRREIYGLSLADTHDFDNIAKPYERQLNLHAAHDIGHAMQDYMLVGCSSFVLNGSKTKDSTLLFGRNFDFYCGEDFAKTKVVSVTRPDSGYAFVSVTWGGMLGVVSGMNEKGLAICINASKLDVPKSVAMPISMLVRHILIHCKNIEEAYAEAKKMNTFVAENIVIASREDNGMAIIEKSPEDIELYHSPNKDVLLCTNHFQSDKFMKDERNLRNYNETDTKYRLELLEEKVGELEQFDQYDVMRVLLNPFGKGNELIGMGNEMAINQLIAHHSIVLEPDSGNIYICMQPKALGSYCKVNIDSILTSKHIKIPSFKFAGYLTESDEYKGFIRYERLKKQLSDGICQDSCESFCELLVKSNPYYFEAYNLAGDLCLKQENTESAVVYWKYALECKIPKLAQRKQIEEKIKKYE